MRDGVTWKESDKEGVTNLHDVFQTMPFQFLSQEMKTETVREVKRRKEERARILSEGRKNKGTKKKQQLMRFR